MTAKKVISSSEKDELRKKLKKRRKVVKLISLITFIALVASSIAFYISVNSLSVLPSKYMTIIIVVLVVICLLFGALALIPGFRNGPKIFQSVVCVILAILMTIVAVVLPSYQSMIEKMFVAVPETGELAINVYVLAEDENGEEVNADVTDVEWLAGRKVATQTSFDVEYQEWAVKVVNKEIQGDDIQTVEYEDIYTAIDALYNHEVSAILLNESYVDVVQQVTEYEDFSERTKAIYSCIQEIDLGVTTAEIEDIASEPFVIGVIAQDSWDYSSISTNTGYRSDTNMVLIVNPQTHQVLIITIPRDSYVGLYGESDKMDKLTHATYIKGVSGWVDTIEGFLDVEINYYVRVNFSSLVDIVDAVGGITVENEYEFSTDYLVVYDDETGETESSTYTFPEGTVELDGTHALAFARERKHLSDGDIGRNKHQAQIIEALIDKCTSPSILGSVDTLLSALEGKFTSNFTWNEISALAAMQLDYMGDWDFISYSITGTVGYSNSYIVGRNLSMVYPSSQSVSTAKSYITSIMSGEIITIEE